MALWVRVPSGAPSFLKYGLVAELVVCTCLLSSDDEGSNPSGTTDALLVQR